MVNAYTQSWSEYPMMDTPTTVAGGDSFAAPEAMPSAYWLSNLLLLAPVCRPFRRRLAFVDLQGFIPAAFAESILAARHAHRVRSEAWNQSVFF
ncbi:hypothetical protein [[Pseudomonas] boreopolis]|uniref:hypothetical protein n=1 Tax=Xanthomonas boreopolis TaxID=86183 RepID=UPI003D9BF98E